MSAAAAWGTSEKENELRKVKSRRSQSFNSFLARDGSVEKRDRRQREVNGTSTYHETEVNGRTADLMGVQGKFTILPEAVCTHRCVRAPFGPRETKDFAEKSEDTTFRFLVFLLSQLEEPRDYEYVLAELYLRRYK